MVVREPKENEMIPSILFESKTVKEFEPDFFIVQVAHGQPKNKKDYTYLKNYDFPVRNRDKNPVKKDFSDYLKRHKTEPSQRKFSCFQLLIFIADMLDIDTALVISNLVAQEKALDPGLVELLESFQ